MKVSRIASHAGSWYTGNSSKLRTELNNYVNDAKLSHISEENSKRKVKAIIGPHAGYSYCGATAAYSYKAIDPQGYKRVFLLGPSHHKSLEGCALGVAKECKTPIGDLQVCEDTVKELSNLKDDKGERMFDTYDIDEDEEEHSLEMHMPWVAKVFGTSVKIIPVLVGQIDSKLGKTYGDLFSKYLLDDESFLVISTDFCHWGRRFRYTYLPKKTKNEQQIYELIEQMDKEGMKKIESLKSNEFSSYLKECKNTICGRHPILILLNAIESSSNKKHSIQFLDYSQSSKCKNMNDSSVSYAAGVVFQDK